MNQIKPFGNMPDGRTVKKYAITSEDGLTAEISDLGATLVSLTIKDEEGNAKDVVLGFDSAEEYYGGTMYLGASVGRYANRIGKSTFSLDGNKYTVSSNEGTNSLHGGKDGFSKRLWQVEKYTDDRIVFKLDSPDGDQGFPGNLTAYADYSFKEGKTLSIKYYATCDKPTVCSMTNHAYFNLCGHKTGKKGFDHLHLTLFADKRCVIDNELIPTGELADVENTVFDLRKETRLADIIGNDTLHQTNGVDHAFVLEDGWHIAAILHDDLDGKLMEVWTNAPSLQVYTGNYIQQGIKGKDGAVYEPWSAVCLETQHFPDAPNHSNFPAATLRPGEKFEFITEYRFK